MFLSPLSALLKIKTLKALMALKEKTLVPLMFLSLLSALLKLQSKPHHCPAVVFGVIKVAQAVAGGFFL